MARSPMPHLIIQRHSLVPDRLAIYESDQTLVASFPVLQGTDPWARKQDAIDFCRQISRTYRVRKAAP